MPIDSAAGCQGTDRMDRRGRQGVFKKTLRTLHAKRFVEFNESTDKVKILPPGSKFVQDLIRKKKLTGI